MDNKIVNQVRQVLMNELGLTRESIRQEMENIVRSTVEKKMDALLGQGFFRRTAENQTLQYLRNHGNGHDEIRKAIGEAAKEKAMQEFDRIYPHIQEKP